MKKTLSVLLIVMMLFSVVAPSASAIVNYEKVPMVYIRGNGEIIVGADGKTPASTGFETVGNGTTGGEGISKDVIIETCVNILIPFLTEGLIWDKWDTYGDKIYEELSPLFEEGMLDGDGNPQYGTQVNPEALAWSEYSATIDRGADGWFDFYDYPFCYDWRLDPYDHVDRLHEYVEAVMKRTGSKKICLTARCFGGSLLMAYLEKYGSKGHIKNVVFSDVLANGCPTVSGAFSGNIDFDSDNLERYLVQLEQCAELDVGQGIALAEIVSEIVSKSMDFFNQIGALDSFVGGVEDLYARLYKALMPAVCRATGMATQANYWTCVYEEDFDQAMEIIYGKPGDELYEEYSGLIAKINNYRERVIKKLPGNVPEGERDLFDIFKEDYGINIAVIAKYGYLCAPVVSDPHAPSDALANLADASFGATCAPVTKTLSDEYIAERIELGFGEYISPDKQVDISTAKCPDTTWIIKNSHHDYSRHCETIAMDFCRSTNLTSDSPNSVVPRFIVYDEKADTWEKMTEDNSPDYEWLNKPVTEPTTESIFVSAMRWFTLVFKVISMLLKGELKFDEIGDMFEFKG